nr:hypothetical protein [Brucella anthropi]
MADRPILFSAPMVRANLDERKTQTRRLLDAWCDEPPAFVESGIVSAYDENDQPYRWPRTNAIGDRLWVREAWWIATRYSYGTTPGGDEVPPAPLAYRRSDPIHYAADSNPPNCANKHYGPNGLRPGSGAFAAPDPYAVWIKKPSIHMPRWASRLTLNVTDVRVQRLQDISEADAIAEGVEPLHGGWFPYGISTFMTTIQDGREVPAQHCTSARDSFRMLWEHINGKGSWDANPWIIAYTYRVINRNIDQIGAVA